MADGKVKFKPGVAMGAYEVWLDGVLLGEVRKFVTRYNLRRVIVVTDWRAFAADGKVKSGTHGGGYDTRRDAAEALVKHARAAGASS